MFIELLLSIVQLELSEEEYFEVFDIKVLQIIFLWIFEKKHNLQIAVLFLGFMEVLFEHKAEKFLIEITLKLDFFGIIQDVMSSIFVNEILINEHMHGDILVFIAKFMRLYSKIRISSFNQLNDILGKLNNYKMIMDSLYSIYSDADFILQQNMESCSNISSVSKNDLKGSRNSQVKIKNN